MAMSKSISKKILLFLLVAITSLCFAVYNLSFKTASADDVDNESVSTESIEGSSEQDSESISIAVDANTDQAVINDRIDEIHNKITAYKDLFNSIAEQNAGHLIVVDANDAILDYVDGLLQASLSRGDYSAITAYLYGDCGLHGLLGIYEVAYEFYNNYVAVDAELGLTKVAIDNNLTLSVDKKLISEALLKLVGDSSQNKKGYSASQFEIYSGSSYSYSKSGATDWRDSNGKLVLDNAKALQAELDKAREQTEKELDYLRSYYFSAKFGLEYSNLTVYESEEDVSEAKLGEIKAKIASIFSSEADYDTATTSIKAEATAYKALFVDLQTALARAYADIHTKSNLSAEEAESTAVLLEMCEEAFKSFEALETVMGYVKGTDGEFHEIEIDLKSGNPVGQENDNLGDLKVALNLMNEYKSLVKRAIEESENALKVDFGVSSEKLASTYVNYAKGLADCLTGYYGKLTPAGEEAPTHSTGYKANQYSYVNENGETVEVVYGSDIVKAFKASPFCDGALVIVENGASKKSTKLDEFKLKSTVVDNSSSKDYEVSLTCIDAEGNEVNYFNSDAKLVAREGATPAIERNLYLILRGNRIEDGTSNFDESIKESTREYLNGRVLKYYFTFTVSSSVIKDGKLSVLEFDEPLTVKITIKFNNAEDFAAMKDQTCALSYCHTKVNAVYSDIEWGDLTMTFNVSNFANQAQIAIATKGESPINLPTLIAIGLVGLIVALFLIWIIVAIIKNWKYKIVFNARGGKFNSCIKVKVHEKFNHPAPPTRRGYKFLGWFLDSKCTVRFAISELNKRGNVKVYAKWISNEEYEKLNEKYAGATAVAGVGSVLLDPTVVVKKDAQIEKIEAEKLSYEAKRAEEERKTEEVKLQAIREIDEAKKNDEARAKAEQEAIDAKAELKKSLAERDDLIRSERADERAKCIEEMQSMNVVSDVDYQEAIAKAKAETEEKLRKEFDEEAKARAEEQAKINEELSNKIKALEDAKAKAEEEAKAKEESDRLAAEEMAKRLAEEEEARRKAEEERINTAIAAGLAAKLAEIDAQKVEAPVEEPVVEDVAPAFDTDHVFDVLKAEIYSYADADDLGYGLEANVPACAMKVVGDTIELEVNLDLDDCAKKGYKVATGEKLPVKFVLASDDDIDEAEELIEETMFVNGLKKTKEAVITVATEETRTQGFEYGLSKDKVADTPEEFYKLLRVFAKSFVLADDGDVEEKTLIKMFLSRGRVYLYLNHDAEGLKACDSEMVGFKAFMTVKSVEDCKEAMALISAMMKANGLVRFPMEVKIAEEDCAKGFTYTLSK